MISKSSGNYHKPSKTLPKSPKLPQTLKKRSKALQNSPVRSAGKPGLALPNSLTIILNNSKGVSKI